MNERRVRLRVDEFDRLMLLRGWKTPTERCQALDISQAQYSKVLNRRSGPGPKFIHNCLHLLGVPYTVLFEIDDGMVRR